ncbi:hypothetical protein DL93DRAFT_718302 [Clavulina sp. PMI_390]|nr:hypothetical protein DL93DRAFT_718302 [Clavulina sp. PMI_390]
MFVARLPLGRVVIVFAFPHNGCWKYIGRLVVMGEYLTFLCLLKLLILEHACTDETLEKRPDPDMSDYDYLGWIAGTVEQRSIESDLQPMIDSVAWEVRKLRRAIQILSRNVTPRDSEVPKIEEHFYPRSLRGNGGVMDDKEFEEIDESMIADAPFYRLPPLIVAVLRDAPGGKAMTRGEILETISRFCPHYRMGPWSGWMVSPPNTSLLGHRDLTFTPSGCRLSPSTQLVLQISPSAPRWRPI